MWVMTMTSLKWLSHRRFSFYLLWVVVREAMRSEQSEALDLCYLRRNHWHKCSMASVKNFEPPSQPYCVHYPHSHSAQLGHWSRDRSSPNSLQIVYLHTYSIRTCCSQADVHLYPFPLFSPYLHRLPGVHH